MKRLEFLRLGMDDLELLIELVELFNEVFEEYNTIASTKHLESMLSRSEFYAIVALREGVVVGGVTAFELQRYYADTSELYIYDIAVSTKIQRQGVGSKLIRILKDHGLRHGVESIFVDAHSTDEEAVLFYESTLGKSEKVDHFVANLKKE